MTFARALGPPSPNALNLKDFGAVIDDSTDDTAAIQAWMNAAATTGKIAFHPGGVARHGALTVPNGLRMEGVHPGGYGVSVPNVQHSRFTAKAGVNTNLWTGAVGVAHVRIANLHFDGNKNNNTSGNMFHLTATGTAEEAQWVWSNCFLEAAAGHGIFIGAGRRGCKIVDKSTINYHGGSGLRIEGSDAEVNRCIIGSNLTHGVEVGASITRVNACDIYGNGTAGNSSTGSGIVVLSTISQVAIIGNGIDRNLRHGISLNSTTKAITIADNMLHSNSQDSNGGAHGIFVNTDDATTSITGNTFGIDSGITNNIGYGIFLNNTATKVEAWGNVMATGSSNLGLCNAPGRLLTTTSSLGAQYAYTPQPPALITTVDPKLATGVAAMSSANQARGARVIVPRTGTLHDIAIWIGTASGNIDLAVYDTTATTRNRLWSSGSVACPTAAVWAIVGDPAISVTAGQQLDFVLAIDNTTATFARVGAGGNWIDLPTAFHVADGGGKPTLSWVRGTSFPLATTLAESGLGVGTTIPLIIARVS
jgi:hypothetical protein